VHGLKSEYRWCLTGTPVTNSLTDVYALFRFLRIKPGNEWDWFRKQVYLYEKKRPDLAGKRVQAILKHCCIRRNKNSELNGKRLITLPDKHVNLVTLDFTEEEREIYTFVETKWVFE
jgi:SNF2 family DNA or RNA helicase